MQDVYEAELDVRFMGKKDGRESFYFPDLPDEFASVAISDVLVKLPVPTTGATARSGGLFHFDFYFECYSVQ